MSPWTANWRHLHRVLALALIRASSNDRRIARRQNNEAEKRVAGGRGRGSRDMHVDVAVDLAVVVVVSAGLLRVGLQRYSDKSGGGGGGG